MVCQDLRRQGAFLVGELCPHSLASQGHAAPFTPSHTRPLCTQASAWLCGRLMAPEGGWRPLHAFLRDLISKARVSKWTR